MTEPMHAFPLTDNWSIRPVESFEPASNAAPDHPDWLAARVPGHWQQMPELQDYSGKVLYRCQFAAPPLDTIEHATRAWLRFNGTFYYLHPFLNRADLGQHEGYFDPYEQEVTDVLQPDNTLLVQVDCPNERDKFMKQMITGVFSHWDCFDPQANPGGIWLPVELHYSGPVRIQSARCHTEVIHERFAQMAYAVEVDSAVSGTVVLRWTIAPRTFDGPAQTIEHRHVLHEGAQQVKGLFKVRDPRLWWTHDLGTPDLYTTTLEVVRDQQVSDHTSFDMGIRQFELRNWIPYLNGTRFLVKGSNYAPGDMRIASITREQCDHDLRLARECHMNLLRVHAHVDHPALYAAANESGMLLWQDMPMQWLYHARVLPEARRQARAMVHLLYNHPSVVVWCMHNEPIYIRSTADERLLPRLRSYNTFFGFSWNRDIMDSQLKRVAQQADPHRPVVRSSGEFHVPRVLTGTDAHLYFGWYKSYGQLQDFDRLRRFAPGNLRFVTEFGAQSFPNVESCRKFLPDDPAQLDEEHLANRHSFQPHLMARWIPWREARSLEELVDLSQDYQVYVNRFYIDRLRYHKYRPTGGIVPFMFCDSYPSIVWSIIDYWRIPKRSYAAMRLAFSPQYAFTLIPATAYRVAQPIELPLYVINDAHETIEDARLLARLLSPEGKELASVAHTLTLDADSMAQEIDRLRLTPPAAGRYRLEIALTGVAQEVRQVYHVEVER